LVKEIPTPKLMTGQTCQISGSQRKAKVFKLHKILRKMTNASGKNWSKSPTRVQKRDSPSPAFPTRETHINPTNEYCL
jgi:hypothetical protein